MGGAIAFDYALQHQQRLTALLLSAPALGVKMKIPVWQEKAANALANMIPSVTLNNGIDATWLSHDEAVVNAYRTDPLVHPKISASLFAGMINAGRRCNERAAELSLPTMMIFGGCDEIVSFDDAHQAFNKINSPDKQELVFENAKHEIHNDYDKEQEFDAMWQWLKTKMS
jgi:alpha-beta hydrolase superfamily lysophospholipase